MYIFKNGLKYGFSWCRNCIQSVTDFFIYCMKGVIVSIVLKIGILKQKYSTILNKISLKQQTYIKNT